MQRARIPALGDERGTSLVEVLLVGVLLAVVVAAAAVFLPSALRLTSADAARVDALDRAGETMERIGADVRQALDVRAPAPDVLELRLLERVPGRPATERWVRWDCTRPDGPGLRACARTDVETGARSGGLEGVLAEAEPVFAVRGAAGGQRTTVAVRLALRTSRGRNPVVLRSSATQRACVPAPGEAACP